MLHRTATSSLWGISIALSWTWGLGLFFSVQIALQFGLIGLLCFAIPNGLGLLLFGLMTDRLAKRQPDARSLEKFFFAQSNSLRFVFLLYQVVAIGLTFFAAMKYFFVPIGIELSLAMLLLIGSAFVLGEQFSIAKLKYSHAFMFVLMIISAFLLAFGTGGLVERTGLAETWSLGVQDTTSFSFVGYLIPICVGLIVGPWLDIQQWQRVLVLRREGGSVRQGYIIGSALFFTIIVFHGVLALVVAGTGLVSVPPVDSMGLFHAKEYLSAVFFGENGSVLLRIAYFGFILTAVLSTLDSGYIALRWYLKELVSKSEHIVMTIVPESAVRSPVPLMLIAVAVAAVTVPTVVQLEYYMAFYATFSVGYSVVLIARTILKPELTAISQSTLFATAVFSLGLFGIGYFNHYWICMALAPLIPGIYGLLVISGKVVVDDLSRALPQPDSSDRVPLPSVSGMAAEKAVHALENAIARLDPKVAQKFGDIIHRIEPTAAHALANVLHAIQPSEVAAAAGTAAPSLDAAYEHAKGHFEGKWFVYSFMTTYQDTNSVGNVYFGMYPLWVGKVREMFFQACMPDFDLKTTPFFILTRQFEHKFNVESKEFEFVTVRLRVESFNRKFAMLEHEIYNQNQVLLGKGKQTLLFVNSKDYSIIDIPEQVKKAFLPHIG